MRRSRNKSQLLCIFGLMNVVDIDSFIARTGRSKADLSRDLGFDPKSSLLAAYQAGRTKPSYDVCAKLLQLGMTLKELFGDDVDARLKKFYMDSEKREMAESPEDVVLKGLRSIIRRLESLEKS